MKIKEALTGAAAIVRRGWCRMDYAQDCRRVSVSHDCESAVKFCSAGAIYKATGATTADEKSNVSKVFDCLQKQIDTKYKNQDVPTVVRWNDYVAADAEEVAAMMEEAAKLPEANEEI